MTGLLLPLTFAGTVALFLWGIHMVQTGVQRAFAANLRVALRHTLSNRFKALLAGIGVTAALQSSTATGLMATSFAAQGLIALVPALAIMLGANIGTTLIVQVLSFDLWLVAPALILVGFIMFRSVSKPVVHDLGRVMIGLGLMLIALHQLLELVEPLEQMPEARLWLAQVSASPVVDIVIGALLAWVTHSSVAVVVLAMSVAGQGIIDPAAALAIVLGANLGTAINPMLEGAGADNPVARRLPLGNLLNRGVGVLLGLVLIQPSLTLLSLLDPNPTRLVTNYHMAFNLVMAALFLPILTPYARLLERLLPKKLDPADPATPKYLDRAARETPIVALGGAAREALRLADLLRDMLYGVRAAMLKGNRTTILATRRLDDVIDELDTAIHSYLIGLDPETLSEADRRRFNEILTFCANMEQAGDVIDRTLLPHCQKRVNRGLAFPDEAEDDLLAMVDRLVTNIGLAASLFMTEDPRIARRLADEKLAFRNAVEEATLTHFMQLKAASNGATPEASALHLDLMRDMKVINSHIVAAIAYPVLERIGELLPSRMATSSATSAE
ncbi:MAG TPA: Na/Pi cotransporter family protein [Devosiaceae bacterium]